MDVLDGLNEAQRQAVVHGADGDPRGLLVVAGAGSGKTRTLVHRMAHLVERGVDPRRILLLTFTRRAAAEMTRRARTLANASRMRDGIAWSGTFHAVANRLLRLHAHQIAVDPSFTILDTSDAADLLDWVRHGLGLSSKDRRFPKKGTCLAIHSKVANTQTPLSKCLDDSFPWCATWREELKALFVAYADEKRRRHVLDYDDLLLHWHALMSDARAGAAVRERFDSVLVDEYQDTNALQAALLFKLRPGGLGLTVVGDDAQSIYAFRGAEVRNILDFPTACEPAARVVTLAENYRSTRGILDGANAVISLAKERFTKDLVSTRGPGALPRLVTVEDEATQVDFVVERILARREEGMPLREQAVLFRAAHHSDALELELSKRGIPYAKYGGIKFLEAAHVKDVLSLLRWVENPRDSVAAFRAAKLVPGVGPAAAHRAFAHLENAHFDLGALERFEAPASARPEWAELAALLGGLAKEPWPPQMGHVRAWYGPKLEVLYDGARARAGDLDELEHLAGQYATRERFLSELSLDPPSGTGDEAGPPHLDDDWLVLSTIHSAKGQEWRAVSVLNVADGCIPSDMATGDADQIEEERRLLYVAMTRAKDALELVHPLRMHIKQQQKWGDRHVFVPKSRFLPDELSSRFEHLAVARPSAGDAGAGGDVVADAMGALRALWEQ